MTVPFTTLARMHEQALGLLLRVGDLDDESVAGHDAGIAHLAAGLAVERRLVDDDADRIAFAGAVDDPALLDQRLDDAFGLSVS